jgi:type I restriction enzyme R subunit
MLGRGTPLCADLFRPGQDKQGVFVFDFCGNLEYFNSNPAAADGRVALSLAERLFTARVALLTSLDSDLSGDETDSNSDGIHSERGLRADIAHALHDIVVEMNVHNFVVRPHRR